MKGRNLTENEHVKLGAYHTIELEQQRPFTIEKTSWDAVDIERIRQACDVKLSADLAAVLITVRLMDLASHNMFIRKGRRGVWGSVGEVHLTSTAQSTAPPNKMRLINWAKAFEGGD
jgi:hypothetical protein